MVWAKFEQRCGVDKGPAESLLARLSATGETDSDSQDVLATSGRRGGCLVEQRGDKVGIGTSQSIDGMSGESQICVGGADNHLERAGDNERSIWKIWMSISESPQYNGAAISWVVRNLK